jgi:hypothetical protein
VLGGEKTWQRPQLVEAVRTLLSLGADPNYTNGHRDSFALANAVHGPAAGLRAMLDAGGDPNARNESGWPIVFMHFKLGYYKNEERARLDMLLDRGADINAVVPATESQCAGCTLLLYTTQSGLHDSNEYANALHLLDRGADPHRVAVDGMTLSKMLKKHRKQTWEKRAAGIYPALGLGANAWDCERVRMNSAKKQRARAEDLRELD